MAKRNALSLLIAAITFALAGCTGGPGSAEAASAAKPTSQLTGVELARDTVARSEAAIEEASSAMATLATQCPSCKTTLDDVSAFAAQRLAGVGGRWEAWGSTGEPADPNPEELASEEVGHAPLRPAALSAYMYTTARQQLQQLAKLGPEDISPNERLLLGSVLAGRLTSAEDLAAEYDTSAEVAASTLILEATLSSASLDLPPLPLPSTPDFRFDDPSVTVEEDSASSGDSDLVADVIRGYDCAASTLWTTPFAASNAADEQRLFDDLLERRIALSQVQNPVSLPVRCMLEVADTEDLFETIIGLDLQLLNSEDETVRGWAAYWLTDDANRLARWAPVDRTLPGLVEGRTANSEANADENG